MIGYLNGMRVVESMALVDQKLMIKRDPNFYKRPRLCKRTKANPKRVITVPSGRVIVSEAERCIYMHPVVAKKLSDQIEVRAEAFDRFGFKYNYGFPNPFH